MQSPFHLTSLQNPRIKETIKLRQRSCRDERNSFLIEGYRELRRAVDANWRIEELYYCTDLFLGENEEQLIEDIQRQGARLFSCNGALFQKLSYRDRPDGLVAVAPQRLLTLEKLKLPKHKPLLIVIAEAIEKPGNLGTILRSCDATAVDALFVCDPCTDVYNPNVVRASVGTLFSVPVVQCTGEQALDWLKRHNIAVLAATPHTDQWWCQAPLTGNVAIAVGTEQYGLSDLWMQKATHKVALPMMGIADSLNVATATSLLLYEVLRQRGLFVKGQG